MTQFLDLFSSNENNTHWAVARQKNWRAARIIAVDSAEETMKFLKALNAGPGIHQVSNDERQFSWNDGAVTCPMSPEGAAIAVYQAWQQAFPPFVPQGAIVWLSETKDRSRRYWVTWPVGKAYDPQRVSVEDIT